MTTTPRFAGKRALVTGASRGLGRTIAEWLARDGADVFISGRDQADINRVIGELSIYGTTIQGSIADLEDISQAHALAENALNACGPIDILVNNAGFSKPQPFLTVSDADWDAELAVNVRAPFVIGQHIARAMIENDVHGRIVNISTIGTFAAHPLQAVYDIAKAGVQAMTRNMAHELAGHGITVNCIAPGAIPDRPGFDMTAWNSASFDIPIQRPGSADDIANAVCFFCQNESSWVTGQTLLVDGGHIGFLK